MRVEDIPRHVLDALLNAYPRTEFKETFSKRLQYQAESKPNFIALPDNIAFQADSINSFIQISSVRG